MKRLFSKKTIAVGAIAGLILGVSGAAFAYWTANGSGTGTVTAGSASSFQLSGSVSGLVVGGNVSLPITETNGGSAPAVLGGPKTVSITNVVVDAGHPACTVTLAALSVDALHNTLTDNTEVAPGNSDSAGNVQIDMADFAFGDSATGHNGGDQSACQGAQFTLTLAAA